MGCDIHGWVEHFYDGRWVGVLPFSDRAASRCYERFAALAGVRGSGPDPVGLPDDLSDSASRDAARWGDDGHSHSWLPLAPALLIWRGTDLVQYPVECWEHIVRNSHPARFYFELYDDPLPMAEYRVVFWFDN